MSAELTDAEKAEKIETRVTLVVEKLTDWARHMAARFNGAVYLVGSTLHNPLARDCDVRIIVPDHEFAARYGMELHQTEIGDFHPLRKRGSSLVSARLVRFDDGVTQRWLDDVAKFTGTLSVKLGLNMDVKVWPDSYWREPYPTPITLAAPSGGWYVYNRYHPKPQAIIDWEAEESVTPSIEAERPFGAEKHGKTP